MNTTKSILLCAAVAAYAAAAGYAILRTEKSRLFPEPFGNVRLGMSERKFGKIRPEAALERENADGSTWWKTDETDPFEDSGFWFVPSDGKPGRTLSYSMLNYKPGTQFREVLAEAENRLGPMHSCWTVLFNSSLCFQRTWRFGRDEATLFFWPGATGMQLQWRIADEPGSSSAHDGFLPFLPGDVGKGTWAGFYVVNDGRLAFDPSGDLSADAALRLFGALKGWESFDPVDLESRALEGDGADDLLRGHWLVEVRPPSPCFAVGTDGSWIANLGTNGIARSVPESRRSEIIASLATLTNAPAGISAP